MKRVTNIIAIVSLLFGAACNDGTKSEATVASRSDTTATATSDQTPTVMDSAAMMKAWETYMTPGQMHTELAKDVGTWDADVTMWMSPDAPPSKSKGTSKVSMIMGGRYQQSEFKGDFGGMAFEGVGTMGYDNAKKVLVSTWVDNMGTGIMTIEGTYDSTSRTYTFNGKSTDPLTGKDCAMRETYKKIDDNSHVMEMYVTYPGGKEYKSMEITYRRKK